MVIFNNLLSNSPKTYAFYFVGSKQSRICLCKGRHECIHCNSYDPMAYFISRK